MSVFNEFPYTNLHELNLDWILKKMKELVTEWLSYNENWEKWKNDTDKAFKDLEDFVTNYFDNLDVQEEINVKLDDMVDDGTLERVISHLVIGRIIYITNENKNLLFNNDIKTLTRFVLTEDIILDGEEIIENMSYCEITSNCNFNFNCSNGYVKILNSDYNKISNVRFNGDLVVTGEGPFGYEWTPGNSTNLLVLDHAPRTDISNVEFIGSLENVIIQGDSHQTNFTNCYFRDSFTTGLNIKFTTSYEPQININNCFFNRNKTDALLIDSTGEVFIYGSVFQFSGNHIKLKATYPLFNISICDNDFENCSGNDIVFTGSAISAIKIDNNTFANNRILVNEILKVVDYEGVIEELTFIRSHIYMKRLCEEYLKFGPTCYIDATQFGLADQRFYKCMGIFKTTAVRVPMYIIGGSRSYIFPLMLNMVQGTMTVTFTEAITSCSIFDRYGQHVGSTEDNITWTFDIEEDTGRMFFVDFGSSGHTSTLQTILFGGTYKK